MTRRLVLTAAAEADIQEAYDWYEAEQEGVGEDFLQVVRAALREIQASPYRYARADVNLRRKFLDRFPYGLYFGIDGDVIVVACCHTRRDPEVWQSRSLI